MAVILALRIPCKHKTRHQKEFCHEHNSGIGSPEPSEKSSESKDIEAIEDEKNPDVVPETMEPDPQVKISRIEFSLKKTKRLSIDIFHMISIISNKYIIPLKII